MIVGHPRRISPTLTHDHARHPARYPIRVSSGTASGMSDSALSKQISTLEEAGYVTVRKTGAGRNRRTHLRLSPRGRRAFSGHAAALQQIIADADTHVR